MPPEEEGDGAAGLLLKNTMKEMGWRGIWGSEAEKPLRMLRRGHAVRF